VVRIERSAWSCRAEHRKYCTHGKQFDHLFVGFVALTGSREHEGKSVVGNPGDVNESRSVLD
jgi:hypothetical protein